jgi:hypothetical protein
MRILGGKDYYDSALAYGQDDGGAIFKRKGYSTDFGVVAINHDDAINPPELDIEWPLVDYSNIDEPSYHHTERVNTAAGYLLITPVLVWFCAKRYAGLRISYTNFRGPAQPSVVHWTVESLNLALIEAQTLRRTQSKPSKGSRSGRSSVAEFMARSGSTRTVEFLIRNEIAIAVHDKTLAANTWIINADVLKSVGFQKVKPAWEAMQELSMFVDAVLPKPDKPIVEITDDIVKRDKHGFDKWTFRKQAAQ